MVRFGDHKMVRQLSLLLCWVCDKDRYPSTYPKARCTFIVDTQALKYLYTDPLKASAATIKVHGAFGLRRRLANGSMPLHCSRGYNEVRPLTAHLPA